MKHKMNSITESTPVHSKKAVYQLNESEKHFKELLMHTLKDYCQYYWSNSWIEGLEYDLWSFVCQDTETMWQTGFGAGLTEYDRDRLRTLSVEAGGWYAWSRTAGSAQFVPLEQWHELYESFKRRGR